MNTNNLFRHLGATTLALAAGLLAVRGAMAEEVTGTTVVTTRADVPTMTVIGHSDKGAPIVLVEVRHIVKVKDLNLRTAAGVDALQARVHAAAVQGCRQINRMNPAYSTSRACVRDAVSEARPLVNAAISEARTSPSAGAT
jgi:UrcA family protein